MPEMLSITNGVILGSIFVIITIYYKRKLHTGKCNVKVLTTQQGKCIITISTHMNISCNKV